MSASCGNSAEVTNPKQVRFVSHAHAVPAAVLRSGRQHLVAFSVASAFCEKLEESCTVFFRAQVRIQIEQLSDLHHILMGLGQRRRLQHADERVELAH